MLNVGLFAKIRKIELENPQARTKKSSKNMLGDTVPGEKQELVAVEHVVTSAQGTREVQGLHTWHKNLFTGVYKVPYKMIFFPNPSS